MHLMKKSLLLIGLNVLILICATLPTIDCATNNSTTKINKTNKSLSAASVSSNVTATQSLQKVVTTTSSKPVTTPKPIPGKSAQSNRNSIQSSSKTTATKAKKPNPEGTSDDDLFRCPNPADAQFQLFPVLCSRHGECMRNIGADFRCCKQLGSRRCVKAEPKPIPEPKHEPLLWIIPRKCPKNPLGELFWDIQTCNSDRDCWPRVCCPDGQNTKKYCRTSKPEFDSLPYAAARQLSYPIESISGYLQCTPPPPSTYDKFPKKCNTSLDCFPNVCCQEAGKKYCRPPRRSLLALVTGVAQRFNTGFVRRWTDNLVIK